MTHPNLQNIDCDIRLGNCGKLGTHGTHPCSLAINTYSPLIPYRASEPLTTENGINMRKFDVLPKSQLVDFSIFDFLPKV